jgi:hypothetical protein
MTKDEALKMAIEAIERLNELDGMYGWGDHLRACKEALEQKEYNVNKMKYKIVPTSPDLIQVNAGIKALEKSNGDTLESELCPDVSSESGDLLKHFGVNN